MKGKEMGNSEGGIWGLGCLHGVLDACFWCDWRCESGQLLEGGSVRFGAAGATTTGNTPVMGCGCLHWYEQDEEGLAACSRLGGKDMVMSKNPP